MIVRLTVVVLVAGTVSGLLARVEHQRDSVTKATQVAEAALASAQKWEQLAGQFRADADRFEAVAQTCLAIRKQ